MAIHLKTDDGTKHVVALGNIKVMITHDDGSWFAQGLDIDFAAESDSFDGAKDEFKDALLNTIDEHLKIHGHIKGILQTAPQEIWDKFHSTLCRRTRFNNVTGYSFTFEEVAHHPMEGMPYPGITFLDLANE